MMRALWKILQHIMSDFQLEPVITAALAELEPSSDVSRCIRLGTERTSSALPADAAKR